MTSFLNTSYETGSPSMSRTDDNLSNSEGPLLKRSFGKNNTTVSSKNVFGVKTVLSKASSGMSCHDKPVSQPQATTKRYCLWAITFILGLVGVCNLLLSITIIAVLRVGNGMEAMEVIPEERLIKFYGRTDLDQVCIQEGVCQGYGDEPIEFSGHNSGVLLTVKNRRHDTTKAKIDVLENSTSFSFIDSFEVKDSRTGNSFFSSSFPNFGLPSGVGKLAVNLAEAHRIVSPVNSSLTFESNKHINIHGAESTVMESKAIIWMADNNVHVKSNNSIILNAKKGIFLDVMGIPLAPVYQPSAKAEYAQFKVCICMPRGKVFRVPISPDGNVKINCASINTSPEHDPCQ